MQLSIMRLKKNESNNFASSHLLLYKVILLLEFAQCYRQILSLITKVNNKYGKKKNYIYILIIKLNRYPHRKLVHDTSNTQYMITETVDEHCFFFCIFRPNIYQSPISISFVSTNVPLPCTLYRKVNENWLRQINVTRGPICFKRAQLHQLMKNVNTRN